jgi:hypothetical protein
MLRLFRMLPQKQQVILERVRIEHRSRREAFDRYADEFQGHGIEKHTNVQYQEAAALKAFRDLLEAVMRVSPETVRSGRGHKSATTKAVNSLAFFALLTLHF